MFLGVVFGFGNKIFGLESFIYDYVRSYTVGVGYVSSYTIIEGLSVWAGIRSVSERYVRKMRDTV